MAPLQHMKSSIEHLSERKREELLLIQEILFEEFDLAKGRRQKEHDRKGRILKIVLFGAHANEERTKTSDETKARGRSDFNLLLVVNFEELTDIATYWRKAMDRIDHCTSIETPVSFIIYSLGDVNNNLAHGQRFFNEIVREGVALYEMPGQRFVAPKPLNAAEAYEIAKDNYDRWITSAEEFSFYFRDAQSRRWTGKAAFFLHQTIETLYTCTLLTLSDHSPFTHNIRLLRSMAEDAAPSLKSAWPDEDRFQRRCFERLRDAYMKSRYSKHYVIAYDELSWLGERSEILAEIVTALCEDRVRELDRARYRESG